MKYFIDTEFIEGKQDKTFLGYKYGETKPTIDLISIGIVNENYKCSNADPIANPEPLYYKNERYYAISKDFNLKAAWKNEWVRENVLKQVFGELVSRYNVEVKKANGIGIYINFIEPHFTIREFKLLLNRYGKTNKQIVDDIICFCNPDFYNEDKSITGNLHSNDKSEFYGYYSDYDWVVFAQLFGTMMDLPKGFPMYCKDLKQILDEKEVIHDKSKGVKINSDDLQLKQHINYPKQTNEHNALADAKWNYELYKFLNTI